MAITGGALQPTWGSPTLNPEAFPVITSVKHLSPDVVEIRRKVLQKRFLNGDHILSEEVIVIDRSKAGMQKHVLLDQRSSIQGIK